MKKIFKSLIIILAIMMILVIPVWANRNFSPDSRLGREKNLNPNPDATNIELSYSGIKVDGKDISEDNTDDVYLSEKTDNGGSSEEADDADIKIDYIVNIQKEGTYEITGALNDCQIAINANNIENDVNIILNGVDITCNDGPAIFVYCKNYLDTINSVRITSAKGTINSITGSRIKESVIGWPDQDEIVYSIQKGYDAKDREEFEEYKYNGAISSDIKLIFDGEGSLNVTSYKKEGIEVKGNIVFESGNYNVIAMDDAINACDDNCTVEINGGVILTKVFREAEEGDGIDSNGEIIIKGGTVYAFSYDNVETGLDTINGTILESGKIFTIGYANDPIECEGTQKLIDVQFDEVIPKGETVVVVDENGNAIFAFKTDRDFQTFWYSSDDLNFTTYKTYVGDDIPEGLVYSMIDLDSKTGKEVELNDIKFTDVNKVQNSADNKILYLSIILILVVIIVLIIIGKKFTKKTQK